MKSSKPASLPPFDWSFGALWNLPKLIAILVTAVLGLADDSAAADQKPLKVYILAGQSNMQGHAHVRTLEHLGMDPETSPLLGEILTEDGTPRTIDDVWISYLTEGAEKKGPLTIGFGADEEKIGPELTFGILMQKHLHEPILIIKTAWGGMSLHTEFRPPSAGPFEFNDEQIEHFKDGKEEFETLKAEKLQATGHYYKLMIDHVNKVLANIQDVYPDYVPDQGYEVAGFVWFQGWNDMVDGGVYPDRDKPGGYDAYSNLLAHFIRDVRKDLSAPTLPFVIGVMGVGGPINKFLPEEEPYKEVHHHFRMAMAAPAAMPEFKGNVSAVLTENAWDVELGALRAREAKIDEKLNRSQSEGTLSEEEVEVAREKFRKEEFTERELEILQKGISNAEYHYLGSAKIMTQIGSGFAHAMAEMARPASTSED